MNADIIYWIGNHLGIENGAGGWYLWWSGFGANFGELTILIAIITFLRHKNCIEKGCWRLGHADPEHGHPVCRIHQAKVQ